MSENKRNLTEKEEYYKLITDEKSNHIEMEQKGAGSQCVRRTNIGSLSFRERYLSLRKAKMQSFDDQTVAFLIYSLHPFLHPLLGLSSWADEEADIREIQQEEQIPCCLPQPYGNGFEYQLQDNG